MKETIQANIGSVAFTLDRDAYDTLKEYLDAVRDRLPEHDTETLDDIERHFAEIFGERIASTMQVVSLETVNEAIKRMGRPADFGDGPADARTRNPAPHEILRPLRRTVADRSIAGVCGGLARFFGTDPTLVRIITLLLFLFASDRLLHLCTVDRIDRTDGIVMLVLYIGLLWFTVKTAGRSVASEHSAKPAKALWLTLVFIVVGLAGLVGGGELFLNHATVIARKLGVSESVIAITLVAGGTSLPELASSVVSVVKGKAGLALGNVLGSNIANILLILVVSATIWPLTMGGITTLDVSMVVLSSLLLFLTAFTFRRKTVDRWEGAIFLAIYAAYIWYLIK